MSINRAAPFNYHDHLIQLGLALGLDYHEEGMCYGFTLMGIDAALQRESHKLNALLLDLKDYTVGEFLRLKKGDAKSRELYSASYGFLTLLADYHNNQLDGWQATDPKKYIADNYMDQTLKLSGIYAEEELKQLISMIEAATQKFKFQFPIALQLLDIDHSIALVYDPASQAWSGVSTGVHTLNSTRDIIKFIFAEFEVKTHTTFKTVLHVRNADQHLYNPFLQALQEAPEWQSLHEINAQKASLVGAKNTSWLALALNLNQSDVARALLPLSDINYETDGKTALFEAIANDTPDIVDYLLEHNAICLQASHLFSPFFSAISAGDLPLLKRLMPFCEDINAHQNGRTMLFSAVMKNQVEIVKYLLQQGAKTDIYRDHYSLLFITSAANQPKILELILPMFKNVNETCAASHPKNHGYTALAIAANYGHFEVVQILLAAKADPNIVTPAGETALLLAIKNNHVDVAKALITANTDLELRGNQGYTPLLMAAKMGNVELVNALIEKGANLQAHNRRMTAIEYAIEENHLDVVKALLKHKVQITDQIFELARFYENDAILQLLKAHHKKNELELRPLSFFSYSNTINENNSSPRSCHQEILAFDLSHQGSEEKLSPRV